MLLNFSDYFSVVFFFFNFSETNVMFASFIITCKLFTLLTGFLILILGCYFLKKKYFSLPFKGVACKIVMVSSTVL